MTATRQDVRSRRRQAWVLAALWLSCFTVGGCAARPVVAATPCPSAPANHFIYVADGAGNSQNCTHHLGQAAAEEGRPVQLEAFEWNHGKHHILIDHVDYCNVLAQGRQLAADIECFRRQHPHTPVYLIGYSSGCGVIVEALAHLPAETVERAFLMSPSLSAYHDLKPSLPAVKTQLHVHYSNRDWWWMGVVTGIVGTTDREWVPTAARWGFHVDDPAMAAKLCQRAWQPSDRQDDNNGGHFGIYGHEFLRRHVLSFLP